jgi:hypothetical protein
VAAVARLHDAKLELSDNHPGLKATLLFPVPTRRQAVLPQIATQKLIARN